MSEKMYRDLKYGELIQTGDEIFVSGEWFESDSCVGLKHSPDQVRVRRPIAEPVVEDFLTTEKEDKQLLLMSAEVELKSYKAMLVESVVDGQMMEIELVGLRSYPGANRRATSYPMDSLPKEIQERVIERRKEKYGIE